MTENLSAFWRRLDRPGHDAARLAGTARGWKLEGFAAFRDKAPVGLHYIVELAEDYATRAARIEGHRSGRPFVHDFERKAGEWYFDGAAVPGLGDVIHLDFGFTPATNLQQLGHAQLAVDEEAEIPAAWFDVGQAALVRLPQHYRRIAEDRYWYSAPLADYEAVLEIAENGFVRVYPGLWKMEPLRG